MKHQMPEWLYNALYYLAPLVIAAGALGVFLLVFWAGWRYYEADQPPPRPRIEVLSTDGARCVVVDGVAVECEWRE